MAGRTDLPLGLEGSRTNVHSCAIQLRLAPNSTTSPKGRLARRRPLGDQQAAAGAGVGDLGLETN